MAGDKKSEGTTRREFLVGTGATLAFGVAGGLAGCRSSTSVEEPKYQVARRIEHDSSLCAGCSVCSLMCSLYQEGETIVALSRNEIARDPFAGSYSMNVCRQCLSPSCYEACPQKDSALCIDKETGAKYINPEECTGCGECVEVCPVEVFELQDEKSEPVNAEECLGCESCVEVCETEAITVEET